MPKREFAIGYAGLALALVLAGLFAPTHRATLGHTCFGIGMLMTLVPVLCLLYRARPSIRVFSSNADTLNYVKDQIGEVCEKGGTVFSTYVLDDPHGATDIVSAGLREAKRPIDYHRLILIDNPDSELEWLSDFLSLNECINLRVSAHLVSNQGRLVSRFIKRTIPFINVFLVKTDSPISRSLFLLSLPQRTVGGDVDPYKFALAIKNDALVSRASSYFDHLLASAGSLIKEIRSIEQYQSLRTVPLSSPKTMSIVEITKECAEMLPEIAHVGVFGTVAHELAGTYVDRFSREYENDLDLVVIVREEADKEGVKLALSKAISQNHADVHVEWSNESPEFYWIREQYQVDIQIHTQHDSYYLDHPLLGCAVFAAYYVLYTDDGKPVNERIGVPDPLIERPARALLYLDDAKFGVRRFVRECASEDSRIDPRRVISINIRNFAWALTGARPRSCDQAFTFAVRDLEQGLSDRMQIIRRRVSEEVSAHQHEDLGTAGNYLKWIVSRLEGMTYE
jgi:hypothetical protein